MSTTTTQKFRVILVYEDQQYGVLLPTGTSYLDLLRYMKKKFKLGPNINIHIAYILEFNNINIIDNNDLLYFYNVIAESNDVMKLYVSVSEQPSQVTHTFNLLPNVNDLNNQVFTPPESKNCWPPNSKPTPIVENSLVGFTKHIYWCKEFRFDDKQECVYFISLKCVNDGTQFKVVRSCPNRYQVACASVDCSWDLYTRRVKNSKAFRITHIHDTHECNKYDFNPRHRNVTARFLSKYLVPKISEPTRVYKPKDIVSDLQMERSLEVSYKVAWAGRHKALAEVHGCPKKSFAQLAAYCHYLKLANPATVTHIETDEEGRFSMLFIAFGVVVRIFFSLASNFLFNCYDDNCVVCN